MNIFVGHLLFCRLLVLSQTIMHFSTVLKTASILIAGASAQAPVKVGNAVVFGKSGTYPRAVRLADNSLLGVYTANGGGNRTITTVKSTDNGASWSSLGEVVSKSLDTMWMYLWEKKASSRHLQTSITCPHSNPNIH